jgi:cysteinyl-tRNA synthetase
MRTGLDDDLNTAYAQGAIFDLVRDANAAIDAGKIANGDIPALLDALTRFDEIFGVLNDDDAPKIAATIAWAEAEGKQSQITDAARDAAKAAGLSDADIDALIAERNQARKTRNFKRSDEIRQQLLDAGIVLEDTKDGVRWKRK